MIKPFSGVSNSITRTALMIGSIGAVNIFAPFDFVIAPTAARAATPAQRARAMSIVRRAARIYSRKDYAQTAQLCREAIRHDAGYVRAYTWLGAAQQKLGQKSAAAATWRRVLQLAPESADAARARRGLTQLGLPVVSSSLRPNHFKPPRKSTGQPSEPVYDVGANLERMLRGHTMGVRAVAFSPDGLLVASGGADRTVRVWDVAGGEIKAVLSGPQNEVTSIAWSPDGRTLAAGSYDNFVHLWAMPNGKIARRLSGGGYDVNTLSWSPDGLTLVGGTGVGDIALWNLQSGALRLLRGHSAGVMSIGFSRDGRTIVSAALDATVRMWDARKATQSAILTRDASSFVALSPDASLLATATGNVVQLRFAKSGLLRHTLKGHRSGVVSLSFSPDGRTLATGSYDTTVRLWDVKTGALKWKLKGHGGVARAVAFSPDGFALATGSGDNTVNLWRVQMP